MEKIITVVLLTGLIALLSCSDVSARTKGKKDFCQLSPEPGRCRASLPKWYYDNTRGECRNFTFGGCAGNANKFSTKSFCERVCKPAGCRSQTCTRTCPQGFIIDAEGCNTCRCQPAPDQESCPAIECPDRCLHGYVTDSAGCMTCDCRTEDAPPRASHSSPQRGSSRRYASRAERHQSKGSSSQGDCGVSPICMMYCEHGFQKDSRGCDICTCREDPPAEAAQLPANSSAQQPEYFPDAPAQIPADVPAKQPSAPDCIRKRCHRHMTCSFGFVKDEFGCDTCVCSGARSGSRRAASFKRNDS